MGNQDMTDDQKKDGIFDCSNGYGSNDLVVTLGSSSTGPAMQAIEQRGSNTKIGTFDLSFGVLESIAKVGNGLFCVDQQQYLQGYIPAMLLTQNALWGDLAGANQIIHTGPAIVDKAEDAATILQLVEQRIR